MPQQHSIHRVLASFLVTVSCFFLISCQTPTTDVRKLDFSKSASFPLPVDARVILLMAPDKRNKSLTVKLTNIMGTVKTLREGWAITDSAKKVFRRAFKTVDVDDLTQSPQLLIKVQGNTEIDTFWLTYTVSATAQVFLADGTALGRFTDSAKVTGSTAGSERFLRDAYTKSFQKIISQMLQNPILAQRFRNGLPKTVALNAARLEPQLGFKLAKPVAAPKPPPAPRVATALVIQPIKAAKKVFPTTSLGLKFKAIPKRPNDIAVIIGNADYMQSGKDIPDVTPAHADADDFRRYAMTMLGIREGNIIDLRDASQADLVTVFGSESSHKGKLFNWTLSDSSNVVVYYAGHGAPGEESSAYLVPVDADPSTLDLNGFRLDLLYANLAKIPAKSVTVVLEACFSGASSGGSVISNASPVFLKTRKSVIPKGITVIAAGGANQIASWDQDKSHGLFTKYYLKGMSGEADKSPYGDENGQVTVSELKSYLAKTMTYFARRYYGRDQNAQIVTGTVN